jgi:hypothetical protein|tara:strand:- start:5362 stop:5628 length:267 start_codon:yes stop_codon:yes gene_type:complete
MGKQRLSPKAAKAKAERDLAYANTDDRKAKRADSQMKRRKAIKNKGVAFLLDKDYDHNTGKFVLSSYNRGGTQSKNKKDGTKAEKNNK